MGALATLAPCGTISDEAAKILGAWPSLSPVEMPLKQTIHEQVKYAIDTAPNEKQQATVRAYMVIL